MVSTPQRGSAGRQVSGCSAVGRSCVLRFPRKSGGLGTAVEPLSRERASAQWALRRRDVRVVLKRKHPPCRGGCGGLMIGRAPCRAPWSLGAGVRRENEGEESGGPRSRDGAAATERSSAQ